MSCCDMFKKMKMFEKCYLIVALEKGEKTKICRRKGRRQINSQWPHTRVIYRVKTKKVPNFYHWLHFHHARVAQNLNIAIINWQWKHIHFEKPLKYR